MRTDWRLVVSLFAGNHGDLLSFYYHEERVDFQEESGRTVREFRLFAGIEKQGRSEPGDQPFQSLPVLGVGPGQGFEEFFQGVVLEFDGQVHVDPLEFLFQPVESC